MRFSKVLQRGVTILVSLGALGLSAPGTTLAAESPKCSPTSDSGIRFGSVGVMSCDDKDLATIGKAENVVVTIDDSGFHPKEITVANGGGLNGNVTFVNLGGNTHTATQIPSSPMWNSHAFIGIGQNDRSAKKKSGTMTNGLVFDTGGITPTPGGTVKQAIRDKGFVIATFGTNGDYLYTSYPDCIAGDRPNPSPTNFDCTPAVVHVVDNQEDDASVHKALGAGADWIGSTLTGTSLRPVGDPECAKLGSSEMLAPGRNNQACIAVNRRSFAKESGGKKSKPLTGNVTVTIDDVYGFDPDNLAIAAGTTVTFVNKPTNKLVHSVTLDSKKVLDFGSDNNGTSGGVDSGGLAPGQSWSFTFPFVTGGSPKFKPSTDADTLYNIDPEGNVGGKEAFIGKLAVVCPKGTFTPVSFDQLRGVGQPCQSTASAQDPAVLAPGTVKDY